MGPQVPSSVPEGGLDAPQARALAVGMGARWARGRLGGLADCRAVDRAKHDPVTHESAAVAPVAIEHLAVLELAEVSARTRMEVASQQLQQETASSVQIVHGPIDAPVGVFHLIVDRLAQGSRSRWGCIASADTRHVGRNRGNHRAHRPLPKSRSCSRDHNPVVPHAARTEVLAATFVDATIGRGRPRPLAARRSGAHLLVRRVGGRCCFGRLRRPGAEVLGDETTILRPTQTDARTSRQLVTYEPSGGDTIGICSISTSV